MRVITMNVNGIRSAAKKGFMSWLCEQQADIVCLQEVRASLHHLDDLLLCPEGFHRFYACAEKPGYSGVGLYSRIPPQTTRTSLGFSFDLSDKEGRYLEAEFDSFTVASIYFPSGTSGDHRQTEKYRFLDAFEKVLKRLHHRPTILCGDWNIAHKAIDLENWKSNQNTSGFLPAEREWMDKVFAKLGWIDAFRVLNQSPKQYTWWSSRSKTAWAKNVGWRIDYQVVSPALQDKVQAVSIYRGKQFSDHAPVIIDYNISF